VDASTGNSLNGGAALFIEQGTANANTVWVQTTDQVTIGTTGQTWFQMASQTRQTVSHTTTNLPDGSSETATIPLGLTYRLMSITVDRPARVRLYDSATAQTQDLTRLTTVPPGLGAGVVCDISLATGLLSYSLHPQIVGSSLDPTPSSNIPITIGNASGQTSTVQVSFLYMVTEH
jgi:hypothetical protein